MRGSFLGSFRTSDERLCAVIAQTCLCLVLIGGSAWSSAQVSGALTPNPTWQELGARNQHILEPLESHWDQMGTPHKQKWLSLAAQYPQLNPEQQARARDRMAGWARMSPEQRQRARLNFSQAQVLPKSERQARWEAYQALPEDIKRELAQQWTARKSAGASTPTAAGGASAPGSPLPARNLDRANPTSQGGASRPQSKLKVVGLGSVQARVGVTTRPLTARPLLPSHQGVGHPRIITDPSWIDPRTLLPLRGPQAAGVVRSATPPTHD